MGRDLYQLARKAIMGEKVTCADIPANFRFKKREHSIKDVRRAAQSALSEAEKWASQEQWRKTISDDTRKLLDSMPLKTTEEVEDRRLRNAVTILEMNLKELLIEK